MSGVRHGRDDSAVMGAFDRKYSDEQREAVERTYKPHKVPATRVVDLAKSGQLTRPDGTHLDAFDLNPHTVRKLWERRQRESLGEVESPLAGLEPRDAVEVLRRRLLNVCDAELASLERKPRGKRDMERVRQIGRAAREAAALPGPNDPKPAKPGAHEQGQRTAGATKGGLAGSILHAARGGTAQDHPHTQHADRENDTGSSAGESAQHSDTAQPDDTLPGSRASQLRSVAHALA